MAETSTPQTELPVKVPESESEAPPALAEPASGPAAEMSGALPADTSSDPKPSETEEPAITNGATDTAPKEPEEPEAPESEAVAEPPTSGDAETQDTETKDAAEPETNGASVESKPAAPKRKSTGGVAEPKGKKLNKKKSVAKLTNPDAQPGEYYIARLKSYPPWPSIICDEDMLPEVLLNSRPVTTKKADGTYNEAYADGGKKVSERTFPIMFLHTNEFAWIHNTDLTPLNPEDCKDISEKGKGKSLLAAYQVAAENHDLDYFKGLLEEHAAALQADEDARLAREAEKAEKAEKSKAAEKKKRKSEVKVDRDVEMEDADAEAAPKKSSKKRKKDADSDDEESEKPPKTPKTTKIKLTTGKTPKTEEKKPKEKAVKGKSDRRKSKPAASDEEMVDVEPEPEEKPLDPAEARKAREKEVLFLRHKLQKGFLSRDQAPQEEEMPQMSTYIKKLEAYADLEVSIIRTTKINKVLKALIKLNTIPRDEEFQFRKRSLDLLSQWNKILGSEPAEGETHSSGDKESKSTPTTNGIHDKSEEPADEKKEEDSPAQDDKASEPPAESEKPAAEDSEEKPEPSADAPTVPEPTAAEEPKAEAAVPEVLEKAPESATAASEAADVVKATE